MNVNISVYEVFEKIAAVFLLLVVMLGFFIIHIIDCIQALVGNNTTRRGKSVWGVDVL